jgi:CubicO group peptidase (beta-lactamase class C family)
VRGVNVDTLKKIKFPPVKMGKYSQDYISWPYGNIIPDSNTGIDKKALAGISDHLINAAGYGGKVFAFMVLHNGVPVAEKYSKGYDEKSRFLGWSMAKSFTNALTGIMVKDSMLKTDQKMLVPEWSKDDRKNITISDLMQMQSGLEWNEDYGQRSDVTLMLYNSRDFAAFAMKKPLEYPVGSHWNYSSGSANIVSYLLRKRFNNDNDYYTYVYAHLLSKIGMPNAVLETDPTGTIAGSSYVYATTRDYARFGLLYSNDGMFNGQRVLPEGWVRQSTTPASQSKGNYGSFFWLNRGNYYASAPPDMYSCNGHNGQRIFIIPSKNLVIVVLGHSPKPDHEVDFNRLLKDVIATVKS